MSKVNIAIFVSGSGSNCENLIRYFEGSERVSTSLVISNRADAYALVRANKFGVPSVVVTKPELNDPVRSSTFIRPFCRSMVERVCGDTTSTRP